MVRVVTYSAYYKNFPRRNITSLTPQPALAPQSGLTISSGPTATLGPCTTVLPWPHVCTAPLAAQPCSSGSTTSPGSDSATSSGSADLAPQPDAHNHAASSVHNQLALSGSKKTFLKDDYIINNCVFFCACI